MHALIAGPACRPQSALGEPVGYRPNMILSMICCSNSFNRNVELATHRGHITTSRASCCSALCWDKDAQFTTSLSFERKGQGHHPQLPQRFLLRGCERQAVTCRVASAAAVDDRGGAYGPRGVLLVGFTAKDSLAVQQWFQEVEPGFPVSHCNSKVLDAPLGEAMYSDWDPATPFISSRQSAAQSNRRSSADELQSMSGRMSNSTSDSLSKGHNGSSHDSSGAVAQANSSNNNSSSRDYCSSAGPALDQLASAGGAPSSSVSQPTNADSASSALDDAGSANAGAVSAESVNVDPGNAASVNADSDNADSANADSAIPTSATSGSASTASIASGSTDSSISDSIRSSSRSIVQRACADSEGRNSCSGDSTNPGSHECGSSKQADGHGNSTSTSGSISNDSNSSRGSSNGQTSGGNCSSTGSSSTSSSCGASASNSRGRSSESSTNSSKGASTSSNSRANRSSGSSGSNSGHGDDACSSSSSSSSSSSINGSGHSSCGLGGREPQEFRVLPYRELLPMPRMAILSGLPEMEWVGLCELWDNTGLPQPIFASVVPPMLHANLGGLLERIATTYTKHDQAMLGAQPPSVMDVPQRVRGRKGLRSGHRPLVSQRSESSNQADAQQASRDPADFPAAFGGGGGGDDDLVWIIDPKTGQQKGVTPDQLRQQVAEAYAARQKRKGMKVPEQPPPQKVQQEADPFDDKLQSLRRRAGKLVRKDRRAAEAAGDAPRPRGFG